MSRGSCLNYLRVCWLSEHTLHLQRSGYSRLASERLRHPMEHGILLKKFGSSPLNFGTGIIVFEGLARVTD